MHTLRPTPRPEQLPDNRIVFHLARLVAGFYFRPRGHLASVVHALAAVFDTERLGGRASRHRLAAAIEPKQILLQAKTGRESLRPVLLGFAKFLSSPQTAPNPRNLLHSKQIYFCKVCTFTLCEELS